MPVHHDLRDTINVRVNVNLVHFGGGGKLAGAVLKEIETRINDKLRRAKTEIAPTVAFRIAVADQLAQKRAIRGFNAIKTGNLEGSITYHHTGGTAYSVSYMVGTDLTDKYPHWVEYGRPPAEARNFKAMRFQPKGSSEYIFAKRVAGASPRPYKKTSEAEVESKIRSIVEQEVNHVLS